MAANNVLVGAPVTGTGGVLHGASGTAIPTDANTAPDPGLIPQGYISEDGLSMTVERNIEKVKAWGGDTVRIIQSEFDVTFSFTFLETTDETLKRLHHEDNVSITAATSSAGKQTSVILNAKQLPSGVWVFDMKDGDAKIRIVCPNAQVSEVGDVSFKHNEVTGREVTVEALPDEDGNQAYMYLDDGLFAPAP